MEPTTNYQIAEQLLREFEPQAAWLCHDSHLHGVDHMTRVFILQELICQGLIDQGVKVNQTATRYAAMVHDVGRVNDGTDPEHGQRSAAWMTEHLVDKLSAEDLDVATYIVHWHVPTDEAAPVMTTELQVMKDADGLDRVRLGDLDPARLRTDIARSLVATATELEALSSSIGGFPPSFEDVLRAADQLGLIKPS